MKVARGSRDAAGVWHPDNPDDYPPMDVHGQLPWSVLDQSAKHWQTRKRWWLDQGVDSAETRVDAAGMIATGRHAAISGGVSRFDPFLTELLVEWFCPAGGLILDPFAGGPVRGVVSEKLGRRYVGVDLSAAQVAENRVVADRVGVAPTWLVGDATTTDWASADLVMSCPPYHNRERYSTDPRDLSAMRWNDFVEAHHTAVARAAAALREDRWLAWVISDVRDHRGHLRGLPALAAQHIRDAGLHLCNELVLVAPPGTRAKTMRVPWEACRTTSRRHQLILVAAKGDRRAAVANVHRGASDAGPQC